MLKRDEHDHVFQHAYVPEHLVEYVTAVSGARPHYFQGYLLYRHQDHLVFIGYPLSDNAEKIPRVYAAACEQFNQRSTTLVADDLSGLPQGRETLPADQYYRLNLPLKSMQPDVAYMVRRAERELEIQVGRFGREHRKIIKSFISRQNLSAAQIQIFKHVSNYLKRSKTVHLIEARQSGNLVAFSIMDTGSASYAFYQFNFRSAKHSVPGASDLLFNEMVRLAKSEGKRAMNMGLGIHSGIRRFKEKWGGEPFLNHHSVFIQRSQAVDIGALSRKL